METGKASVTAQLVAGLRAAHFQSGARPLVFENPFAAHFTGGVFPEPLERGELQAYLDQMALQPIQGGIVGRVSAFFARLGVGSYLTRKVHALGFPVVEDLLPRDPLHSVFRRPQRRASTESRESAHVARYALRSFFETLRTGWQFRPRRIS